MIETEAIDVVISTDPARLDLDVIHGYLARSYWAAGIPREVVARAMANSLCFGAFAGGGQVGFARVVTDRATFAYLCDVFVLESHRGRGVGKRLMAAILAHPDVQGLRRLALFTRDAHGLYRQFGFRETRFADRFMEVFNAAPYGAAA
jgi:GNAT superfamily N-acetyltransferase